MTRITPGILLVFWRLSTSLPTDHHVLLTYSCRQAEWTDWVAVAVNRIYQSLLSLWRLVWVLPDHYMCWSKFLLFKSMLAVEFAYAMSISFYSYISRDSWEKSHFISFFKICSQLFNGYWNHGSWVWIDEQWATSNVWNKRTRKFSILYFLQ